MPFDIAQVRAQFPSLNRPIDDNGTLPVFLDNPAGTQVPQSVIDAVSEYYVTMNANSGGAFATSRRNDDMMQRAREKVAKFLNAPSPKEIVFGANMTTLNFALSRAIAQTLEPGDELILTRMDHDANISPWLRIAEDNDLTLKWVDINVEDGTLDLDSYEAALSKKTKIVACVHASNALGTINPIQKMVEMAHAAGSYFVVDAVQSAPHIPIDVQALGCDFLLCSAYKFFGPHIGIMWGKYDLLDKLPAYKVRPAKNTPPDKFETGTLSFETIHATAAAIDYLATFGDGDVHTGMEVLRDYEQSLVTLLIMGLQAIDGVTIAGITDPAHFSERVPTVTMVMEGHTPEEIATYLAEHNIYVWNGDYYALEVMDMLGRSEDGMVRIGLAHYNTPEEIERLLDVLKELANSKEDDA
ncbi:MAG: cysteine desulfurase-like protein [Aggregatilineales bacterium]